jgi:RNA 3'-terminal phosphate cyclase (ATP)
MVLKGGTNASMAPQYDYWERVFWKTLCQRCELRSNQVQAKVLRRGFYPQGGGEVHVTVEPLNYPLRPVQLTDRGDVSTVYIRSFHAGKLPRHLAEGMAKSAKSYLQQRIKDIPITVEVVTERQAVGSGMGLLCVATTTTGCLLAGSALSSPKKKARDVGIEAAEELFSTLQDGGCVDEWLQDQLILYAALADGVSEILTGSLTLHTKTAVWVAEEMCGATFEITKLSEEGDGRPMDHDSIYGKDGRIPGKHLIRCHGIGFGP